MTLGQEFSTYARHAGRGRRAAAGGGAADPRDQHGRDRHRHRHQRRTRTMRRWSAGAWSEITGIPLVTAPNLVEATQDCGAFVQLSGVLKRVAVKLSKTCNDLRLLSSGPRAGLGEINLPADAGRLQHHAGQGQPGYPRGGQPDRLRGHRQRRHRELRGGSRAAPAQRLRADHRAQPVQKRDPPAAGLPDAGRRAACGASRPTARRCA